MTGSYTGATTEGRPYMPSQTALIYLGISPIIGHRANTRREARVKKFVTMDVFGINIQTLGQLVAFIGGARRKLRDVRPGLFGVDEIDGQRRDAAPIVQAGAQ